MEAITPRSRFKRIADWTLPPEWQKLLLQWRRPRQRPMSGRVLARLLAPNRKFKDAHTGGRCFILGSGPSINSQDLTLLKGEFCIALSQFHLHKDYAVIRPSYHLLSGLAVHPHISAEAGYEYLKQIEINLADSTIFLNAADFPFIQQRRLFQDHAACYLDYSRPWDDFFQRGIDATRSLYLSEGIPVMALQVALYLGFEKIYLLGLDHDWVLRFVERRPGHFYTPEQNVLNRHASAGWEAMNWHGLFVSQARLWTQYQALKTYAEAHNRTIYNATHGGLLDVFERADYAALFGAATAAGAVGDV